MAGFAVVMTFLTWGFILTIGSIILSIVLFRLAKRSFPDPTYAAKRYRTLNVAAPFLALGWLVATLILYTFISNILAHQSVGYSPDPYVTLPNGYVVGSLNTGIYTLKIVMAGLRWSSGSFCSEAGVLLSLLFSN